MAVYSRYVLEEDNYANSMLDAVDVDELIDDDSVKAGISVEYESTIDAAARAVAETTQNWNNIMRACAINEFCYFEENGTEFIYEGTSSDGFWAKVKEVFNKIWEKIKEIFKKFLLKFNVWTKSDKSFLSKYKKDITAMRNKGFGDKEMDVYSYNSAFKYDTFKGIYDAEKKKSITTFSIIDAAKTITGEDISDTADEAAWKAMSEKCTDDKITDVVDTYRADVIKRADNTYGNSCDASSFSSDLKEAILGDKDSKKLDDIIGDAMTYLDGSEKLKNMINSALKAAKKSIDDSIKVANRFQTELLKNKDTDKMGINSHKHTIATKYVTLMTREKNAITTANGVCLECIKILSRQSKAICVAAINYKKPKGVDESAVYESESGISLLDSLQLI